MSLRACAVAALGAAVGLVACNGNLDFTRVLTGGTGGAGGAGAVDAAAGGSGGAGGAGGVVATGTGGTRVDAGQGGAGGGGGTATGGTGGQGQGGSTGSGGAAGGTGGKGGTGGTGGSGGAGGAGGTAGSGGAGGTGGTAQAAGTCTVEADCTRLQTSVTLHCDTTLKLCVECLTDGQCAGRTPTGVTLHRCDIGQTSLTRDRCVPCNTGTQWTDCPRPAGSEAPICGDMHYCLIPCTKTQGVSDCPSLPNHCEDDSFCQPCDLSSGETQCASGTVCVSGAAACAGCDPSKNNCSATTPLCDPAKLTCVQCTRGSDCPANLPVCDPGNGVCRAGL